MIRISISKELRSFLQHWHDNRDNPVDSMSFQPTPVFVAKTCGLCNCLLHWSVANRIDFDLEYELTKLLGLSGLDVVFPFETAEEYFLSKDKHLHPARRAWVEEMLSRS